ncbi:hypothetical protein HMPREF1013_05325 [Bacillus sp. 2_A_57_CT2]|nr:hypothetical protein HMPREF1013_05325 [Bacillus sp. 2_A_57_CT2]
MIQVKLFDCGTVSALEEQVNEFLKDNINNTSIELVDIKFNSYNYRDDRTDYHSAMIIYKV